MRKLLVLLLTSTLALALVAVSSAQKPKEGKDHKVKMLDNKFSPADITVEVGDTVTWVNDGERPHTATADKKTDPNHFDTGKVEHGKSSKAVTFKKAGSVPYHCEIHPKMKGTVTVKGGKEKDKVDKDKKDKEKD